MIFALASGTIFRPVEIRTAKSGRLFASTTLKCRDGDSMTWVKVLAFSDHTIEAFQRLGDGDGVAVQGVLRSEVYTSRDGETRVALTIIADQVCPPRARPRQRKPKPKEETSRHREVASMQQGGRSARRRRSRRSYR
ncbi:single-stranded DNA-binding protein [Methylocystis suflitae]|uniref:single-stranded DNA-binding protein n=1 Tax=Methylocystis suflitae TaxID=2951405 RepID=UPI0038990848